MKKYTINAKKLRNRRSKHRSEDKIQASIKNGHVYTDVEMNLKFISDSLCKFTGLVTGEFETNEARKKVGIAYLSSMSDKDFINKGILEPLLSLQAADDSYNEERLISRIKKNCIRTANIKESDNFQILINEIIGGNTVVFIEYSTTALCVNTRKLEKRSIESPQNETNLLSSKDAFSEDIETNCSLLIRRLNTKKLNFHEISIGKLSRTSVKLVWVSEVANEDLVEEVKRRLEQIDTDIAHGIGQISEFIEDRPLSLYPKYLQTERPDFTAMFLSEGRVGILCDGSPFAMIAPTTFWDFFKTMDDYNDTPISVSFSRIVRYLAFFISVIISPLYLCFVTYNHIIVPPELALNFSKGRENVPFPTIVELLFMTFMLNIIKEAGLRMPGTFGYFAGTLSAIIIGQAAVTAGYVSASLIIIIAISAITSFSISNATLVNTSRIFNYTLVACSSIFGIFGLFCGIIFIVGYICRISSFGVPYIYPLLPYDASGAKNTIIRAPFSILRKRPKLFSLTNRTKIGTKGITHKGGKNGR